MNRKLMRLLGVLFLFASIFNSKGLALNQLLNSDFTTDYSGWTRAQRLTTIVPMPRLVDRNVDIYDWNAANGGCYYVEFVSTARNRDANAILSQSFSTPADPVNIRLQFDHMDFEDPNVEKWLLQGTIRDALDAANYPNEAIINTFFNEQTIAPAHIGAWNSFTTNLTLSPSSTYIYRVHWHFGGDNGEGGGAYIDNCRIDFSPTGLTANPNGANIDLAWNASTGAADQPLHAVTPYFIYRSSTSGGPYVQIGNSSTNSWTDTAPLPGINYYVVTDYDVNLVESPYSKEAFVITINVRDGTAADVDTVVGASVDVNWDAVATPIIRYQVALGSSPGTTDIVGWTDAGLSTSANLVAPSMVSGNTYYASVRVETVGGFSNASSSDGFTYYAMEVRDGTGADIDSSLFPDTVDMNWDSIPLPVLRYDVAVGTTPGGNELTGWTSAGTSTSISLTGLPIVDGTTYYCSVRPIDMGGTPYGTVFSDGFKATIPMAVTVRDGLGPDINESFLDNIVEANWDHPVTGLVRYEVGVGTTAYSDNVYAFADVGHSNSFSISGITLASGTRYYTTVRGYNEFGDIQAMGSSDGFVARRDPVTYDTASQTYFHNARVLDLIDTTTDPNSIRPRIFSNSGGGYWTYSREITVTEPNVTERINAPCRIQMSGITGMGNVREIRVCDSAGNELPRYNLPTSTTTDPDFVFLINIGRGETRSYYVYWGNPSATDPAYGFVLSSGQISVNEWTPYYTRKNVEPGMETVPLALNFGYNPGVDFERGGNYTYYRDDARSDAFDLPWPFYFYGTNYQTAWRANTNGLLYRTSSNYVDYSNTWGEFIGTRWGQLIAPFWVDLKYDNTSYPSNPGVFMDVMTNPDRVVFTWRTNRYTTPDDIYIFQTVLYSTGDICHRYGYLSTRGVLGPGGTDRPVNTENTVGISNNDSTRYMYNTPLNVGIAKSPSAFYQCMDAFRGSYVLGPINAPSGGWANVAHIESMVVDTRMTAPDWQRIEYDCAGGASGRLVIDVRTGSTPLPDGSWGAWQNVATVTTSGNTALSLPSDRYLQYRVTFQRNGVTSNPVLSEVRLVYGGISIEEIVATTPNGVSQGQNGIPVEVKIKNNYVNPVNLDEVMLTFSLGTYTQTLTGPVLPVSIPVGSVTSVFFTVDVDDLSPTGTATVDAVATASFGVLTFSDNGAQIPHEWQVKKKAELVITMVETDPTHVNKGQSGIPVRMHISNIGEVPYTFDGATLTFSLGDYTQAVLSPAVGTVIPENSSFIATVSVDVLLTSPSGVSVIGGTASGTNTFSGKITEDAIADITDSWTIQNPAQLVLEEVTASATVYRGQTNTPVFLRVSNPGEAIANWNTSDILSHFTLGTYDAVYSISAFPIQIPGGLETTARYGVDISPVSATGLSAVDADISGTDDNTLFPITWSGALLPASWTILAEKVNTFKDSAHDYPSASFNRPAGAGTVYVYAKAENLLPLAEFVVRWFDPTDAEVQTSVLITADASGTLSAEYPVISTSPYGQWKVQITNPTGTIVACENFFDVVSPADLSILFTMPSTVSVGQPFVASLTFVNSGGAAIDSGYISPLDYFGPGVANLVNGPTPAVINVSGNGQATATYEFLAVTAGNFSASATAYGFDANSGQFLTSPSVTSNICVIQDPPVLVTQSITAIPSIVYLNQKNLSITVDIRNNGQATAVLTAASITFSLGSFDQVIVSPSLPYSLAGGSTVTFTYDIGVASDSATGLSTFNSNVYWYDSNYPASASWLTGAPTDSWTISDVGITLSRESDFDPVQKDFNQGQTIYIRAYGITPLSQWYRIRLYNSEIPQAPQGPTGWQNVSPQLSADADGYVDYLYTLPGTATIGTWSVLIEDDADKNGGTRGNMLGLQYFRVQNPGDIQTQLYVSPASVFVGENFTVTMVATNTVNQGSTINSVVPSALGPAVGAAGSAVLISGPTPTVATLTALNSQTYTWTYQAVTDTGLSGSYSLTSSGSYDASGIDANTGSTVTSNQSVSNTIVFYNKSVVLSSATIDFGTLDCGETLVVGDTSAVNNSNYPLDIVRWITTDLNGPLTNKISKVNLGVSPSPFGVIAPGTSVPASATFFVPYNQYAGDYIATMSIYNDRNFSGSFDIDEVYDLFNVKVTVPSCKKVFMVEQSVDLEGWTIGQQTTSVPVHGFSGGNLPLDNVKFKQITGPVAFTISVSPDPGPVSMSGSFVASVSADTTGGSNGDYIATWTVWNDFDSDNNVDPTEASDTFQVAIQIGTRVFNIAPSPINAGSTTPSNVLTGIAATLNNTGTLKLSKLKTNFAALSDGGTNTIASDSLSITPAIPQPVAGGDSVPITFSLYVPAGTAAGNYSGTQMIYHDDNLNGSYDAGEAQATFDVQVTVLPAAKVQVLVSTVDVGGIAPGTSKIVSIPCRNVGNVDLTALYWEKTDLQSGADTIPLGFVTFPPTEPFSVPAGQFFNHDIQISVPGGQPYGTYWSTGADYWLFEDNVIVDAARTPGEPESNFKVTCQVGFQAVDIQEAILNSSGDPNSTSTAATLNAQNTGSLSLSRLKATATALIPTVPGPPDIPATCSVFIPSTLGSAIAGQIRQSNWSVNIPANQLAGNYTGTVTVWEDANDNGMIDAGEALDTASLALTVNAKRVIDVLQTQVDLGWSSRNSIAVGNFTIQNSGNIVLTNLSTLAYPILFGANTIPAASISFDLNGVTTLPIGAQTLATVTVTIGSVQADGTYSGNQRAYDDYNPTNSSYDAAGEESDTFELLLRIGQKSFYEQALGNPPVVFGALNPGAQYNQNFTVYNSSAVPLTKMKWKVISDFTDGSNPFPAGSLEFLPAGVTNIAGGGNRVFTASTTIDARQIAGNYVATATIWEDDDNDNLVDSAEASATFMLTLTVNSVPGIDIYAVNYDFGQIQQGATGTSQIMFRNTGNTVLNSFVWTFSPLNKGVDQILDSELTASPTFLGAPLNPGDYGTSTVYIHVPAATPVGVYGPSGPQTLEGDAIVTDWCNFQCEVTTGTAGLDFQLEEGVLAQEIDPTIFATAAPYDRYFLSAWVCPGSSSADVGFVWYDAAGVAIATSSVHLTSAGDLTTPYTDNMVNSGILETKRFPNPYKGNPGEPDFYTYYRVFLAFDYVHNPAVVDSTKIIVGHGPAAADPSAVWFDGVKLERIVDPTQQKPTAYSNKRTIFSPTKKKTVGGEDEYYEW